MACLDEAVIAAFLEGRDGTETVDDHIAECASCRQLVMAAAQLDVSRSRPPSAGRGDGRPPPTEERYEILDVLGSGGMGIVYAARDRELGRKVAIKVLRTLASDDAAQRLIREGRAIARLSHPNVVHVYDVVRTERGVFVAMELVEGEPLSVWLAARPRPWRDVIAVFLQAGEGLAAAHAAGLVHRDFKPSNVFVGKDGRARVGDFGLARLERELEDPARRISRPSDAGLELTQTGAILGSPAYMPPEQFEARSADARSDQFSFAVSLYEGLVGTRPFQGATAAEIYERTLAGGLAFPRTSRVPRRIQQAVLRGLAAAPEDRHQSLAAMLAALRPDRPARRWPFAVAGAGVAAAIATLAVTRGHERAPCEDAGAEVAGVWDLPQRALLVAALTHLHGTPDRVEQVIDMLDARSAAWIAMRRETCTAAQVHDVDKQAQQNLRTACLAERLRELRITIDLLVRADREVAQNAVVAIEHLPPLASCTNVRTLSLADAMPADPATAAQIGTLREDIARARALGDAGKYAEARELAGKAAARADAIAYRPVQADALFTFAVLTYRSGKRDEAEPIVHRAIHAAEAGHADEIAADAWIGLIGLKPETSSAEIDSIIQSASAAVERLGGDARREARLLQVRGIRLQSEGKLGAARPLLVDAVAKLERAVGPDHIDVGDALSGLADVENDLGHHQAAAAARERAIAIRRLTYGPEHPKVGVALTSHARTLEALGQGIAAEREARRGTTILEASLGVDNRFTANARLDLADILYQRGRYSDALAAYETSRATLSALHDREALALGGDIAACMLELGRRREAREELERVAREASDAKLAARTHAKLALVLVTDGQLRAARDELARATPTEPSADADVALVLIKLGRKGGIERLERAIAALEAGAGHARSRAADLLVELGDARLATHALDAAAAAFQRSIDLRRSLEQTDHPSLQRAVDGLARARGQAREQ